jgi:hypothetical protein
MCTIKEMRERLQSLSLIDITGEVMQSLEVEEDILDLNRNQLYESGIDSKGNKLHQYRSNHYRDFKYEIRGRELTDLFLTGQFQRNFYITVENGTYDFYSTDSKTQKLIDNYGDQIFGLTEENKIKAHYIIRPLLLQVLRDKLKV